MSTTQSLPASDTTKRICIDCLLPDGLRVLERTLVYADGSVEREYRTLEVKGARCTNCHAEALAADLAVSL